MANDRSVLSLLGFLGENPDQVIVGKVPKIDGTTPETGMDRLRRMFQLDEHGYQSKQIVMINQTFWLTALGGGIAGAVMQSRDAFHRFLENNQATKFNTHLDAKRELQRVMTVAFSKGAWQWGLRISLFSLTFTTLMTTVSVYRGKESLLEYLVAGGVTGALYKMNLGLKGAIAGCVAGSALSGIAGGASLLILKLGGQTMDDMASYSKMLKDSRNALIRSNKTDEAINEYQFDIKKNVDDTLFKNLETEEDKPPS